MKKYFFRVIYISILGMLFTAMSNANLGIVSQISAQNDNQWVGPLSVGLLFLGSGTGALYNKYIGQYKYRYVFVIGTIGWLIYLSFSVMFLFLGFETYLIVIIVVGSFGCGLIMSLYYNSLNNYVNICGQRDNKVNLYFGINISTVQCSNIIGNGISAILIQPLGQQTYSIVMLCLAGLVAFFFIFVRQLNQKESTQSIRSEQNQSISLIQGKIQKVLSNENLKQNEKKIPVLLFFCFSYSGIMISFVYAQFAILFYKYYKDMVPQDLNHLTFVTFMIQGVGQCIGGLVLAFFAQKIKRKSLYFTLFGSLFITAVIIIWIGFANQLIWLVQLSSFFLGMADCFCFATALSIAGTWYESGFSLFNFGQSFTVSMMTLLYIFLQIQILILIYCAIFCLSTFVLMKYKSKIDYQIQSK